MNNNDPTGFFGAVLGRLLPGAITRAAESYDNFSQNETADDAKSFASFHTACKAALGHLTALGRLSRLSHASKEHREEVEQMLKNVRQTLSDQDKPKDGPHDDRPA